MAKLPFDIAPGFKAGQRPATEEQPRRFHLLNDLIYPAIAGVTIVALGIVGVKFALPGLIP